MAIPGSGLITGMGVTLRNLFRPKVTLQYPEERPNIPDRWRGRLDLIYDPFGEHKCEVCFQCAQVCPVEAIDMSGFDSEGNRIRYGLPEIYDERKDPNAYRRAGLPARPMRNAVRWQDAVDDAWVDSVIDGFGGRPEALVAIFGAVQAKYGYLPEPALRRISDRMLAMLINEAADALFWRIASRDDIDLAMTKGVHYPKGLLRWGDELGASVIVERLDRLQGEYGESRYRASPLLRRMAGSGARFYS